MALKVGGLHEILAPRKPVNRIGPEILRVVAVGVLNEAP
jgi:hypothetical protein